MHLSRLPCGSIVELSRYYVSCSSRFVRPLNSSMLVRSTPSLFRLTREQAPGNFRNFSRPKIKIPPPGCSRRWDSRIARYDSRVLVPRRQKTQTYSRYNRGKPAWSSGRRKSCDKSTERLWPCQSNVFRSAPRFLMDEEEGCFRLPPPGSTPIRLSFFSVCTTICCAISSNSLLDCVKYSHLGRTG